MVKGQKRRVGNRGRRKRRGRKKTPAILLVQWWQHMVVSVVMVPIDSWVNAWPIRNGTIKRCGFVQVAPEGVVSLVEPCPGSLIPSCPLSWGESRKFFSIVFFASSWCRLWLQIAAHWLSYSLESKVCPWDSPHLSRGWAIDTWKLCIEWNTESHVITPSSLVATKSLPT